MKLVHNKIKNTSLLFEVLVRQITKDTLENRKDSVANKIIQKYFHSGSQLRLEYDLYRNLLETKFNVSKKADSFIDVILKEHQKIDFDKLKKEKYNIIKEMSQHFNIKSLFLSHVDDYKIHASIFTLFESNIINESISNPRILSECRFNVMNHMIKKEKPAEKENDVLKEIYKKDKDVQLLTYKLMLEKFNDKYGTVLNTNQKNILRYYIYNISNPTLLREFITNKSVSVKETIEKMMPNCTDKTIKIKMNQLLEVLSAIKDNKKIKEEYIIGLLRSYELIKEMKIALQKQKNGTSK